MRNAFRVICMILVCWLVTGCASMQSSRAPGTDLSTLHTFYVQKLPEDDGSVVKVISDRLNAMGYQSTYGAGEHPPKETDSIVTYQDRWMWDITMYMIELTVILREPKTDFPLARGNSMHTSLTRLPPKDMVQEVTANMFKDVKK